MMFTLCELGADAKTQCGVFIEAARVCVCTQLAIGRYIHGYTLKISDLLIVGSRTFKVKKPPIEVSI